MDDPVEDSIRGGGVVPEDFIPLGYRQLRDDDGGLLPMPVLYDFHEVKQLLSVEHPHPEVVEDEQVGLRDFGEEAVQGAGDARQRDLLEEAVEVEVGHLVAVHAGLMPQRGGEPSLAGAGGTGHDDGYPVPDVVAVGQVEQLLLVHAVRGVEQDLVDGGLVAVAGLLQELGVAAHRAAVMFDLYHQRQAVAQGEHPRSGASPAGLFRRVPFQASSDF